MSAKVPYSLVATFRDSCMILLSGENLNQRVLDLSYRSY